ncbi:MAG: hypothetical protein AB7I42_26120 [Bradyrhizobium sp.]|uniref:hypothetical protein n=1 Tax=Bradyrhizobium sp. TaxID=376 RepID=UPI003D10C1E3
MAGLGFAPEPVPSPAAPASAPQLDTLGPNQPRQAPLSGLSRTQKIGALLQNFGRGVAGQPLYTDELRKQRQQDEALELERLNVGVSAMTKGMELLKNTPAGKREIVAKQFGQMYEHILPGFTETFTTASQQPEVTQEMMDALGEHAEKLITIGGSLDGALKLAQNPAFMSQLKESADERNAPEIAQAFQRGAQLMQQSPETKALWDQMTQDGLTIADLQDPTFRDALGLTESHVRTIMRSPEVQSNLRPFGFKPTADADAKAKAEAGRETPEEAARRAGGVAAAEAAAREAAKMITFLGPNNAVIRRPQGEAEALRAQGFQPIAGENRSDTMGSVIQGVDKDGNPVFFRVPKDGTKAVPVEGVTPPPKLQLGAKQLENARSKLQSTQLARKQLDAIKDAWLKIKDTTFSAGPGASLIPTEAGRAFDKAVDAFRQTNRTLTRTPGEGALSDFETRLAQAALPDRGDYESVTEQSIQQLQDMLDTIESGYSQMIDDATPQTAKGGDEDAVADKGDTLPAAALKLLKENKVTTFSNGQRWTLTDGKPERVQ